MRNKKISSYEQWYSLLTKQEATMILPHHASSQNNLLMSCHSESQKCLTIFRAILHVFLAVRVHKLTITGSQFLAFLRAHLPNSTEFLVIHLNDFTLKGIEGVNRWRPSRVHQILRIHISEGLVDNYFLSKGHILMVAYRSSHLVLHFKAP